MITLRCTAKLLARLPHPASPAPPGSTTRLGDWYANLLFTRPARLVLCASERTLLPVLVPAKELASLPTRLAPAVGDVLRALGAPADAIAAELREMDRVTVAKTANRRVLGTMTDFAWLLEARDDDPGSPLEMALELARSPCSVLGMESPDDATRALFGVPRPRPIGG